MAAPPGNDIYIVSDLHLGEGWNTRTQRYSRLEMFFYDQSFGEFIDHIIAQCRDNGRTASLVLNGDIFDFLAVVATPMDSNTTSRFGRAAQHFGLGTTEKESVWKMRNILAGHPTWVEALTRLLRAGHSLVMIRGNHDAELYWPAVQKELTSTIVANAPESEQESLRSLIEFRQWFLYEPDRYFIEHGNQYDTTNAFRFVTNPVLPPEYHADQQVMLDLPMGSLFMRYLYNKMRLLDPYTTHFVTLEQYLRITYHHNFVDLLRMGTIHVPYFFRAIREARLFEQQGMAPVKREHETRMEALAQESDLGDKLGAVERLAKRPIGTTKYNLLKQILRPVVRSSLTFVGLTLLSVLGWFYIFNFIQETEWLTRGLLGKSSLQAVLAVVTFIGLFLGFSFVNRALHRGSDPGEDGNFEIAKKIAALLNVPCVSMGHTHGAQLRHFDGGAYANSGTWIPHPGPWDTLTPGARQFTFVTIIGTDMSLRRWNTDAKRAEAVILLDDYRPTTLERLLTDDREPARLPEEG